MTDIRVTIHVPPEGDTETRIESTGGDPRPALHKAVKSLLAEIEGYENCPAHRAVVETANDALKYLDEKFGTSIAAKLAEGMVDGSVLRIARRRHYTKPTGQDT